MAFDFDVFPSEDDADDIREQSQNERKEDFTESAPTRPSAAEDLSLYLSVRLAPGSSIMEKHLLELDIRHAALQTMQDAMLHVGATNTEAYAVLKAARDDAYRAWKEYAL